MHFQRKKIVHTHRSCASHFIAQLIKYHINWIGGCVRFFAQRSSLKPIELGKRQNRIESTIAHSSSDQVKGNMLIVNTIIDMKLLQFAPSNLCVLSSSYGGFPTAVSISKNGWMDNLWLHFTLHPITNATHTPIFQITVPISFESDKMHINYSALMIKRTTLWNNIKCT